MTEPSPDEPKLPAVRFTILYLMIAIAIIAVLLTFPVVWVIATAILSFPIVSTVVARRLQKRGHRTLAGVCFWTLAVVSNGLYVAVCRSPVGNPGSYLVFLWFVILMPSLAAFANAWVHLMVGDDSAGSGDRPKFRVTIHRWAILLAVILPVLTAISLWPFRLIFLTMRPQMDRVADQVTAGKVLKFPMKVGQIEIFGAQFDRTTGNVLLQIDRGTGSPNGFVRRGPGSCSTGPLSDHRISLGLKAEWCYHEYET